MGRVISLINITIDGFADGKHTIIDAEYFEFVHTLIAGCETLVFGRKTFEIFQERWMGILYDENAPDWQLKMAKALNNNHKIVFSSNLKTTKWNNTSIVEKADADHINNNKKIGNGSLLTFGSLELVANLTKKNLIDDYYFCVQPTIAGNGDERLFDKIRLENACQLKFVASTQLKSGVHIIHYQTIN